MKLGFSGRLGLDLARFASKPGEGIGRGGPRLRAWSLGTMVAFLTVCGLAGASLATVVEFRYQPANKPGQIHLAGSFNNWNASGELLTDPDGDGVYTVSLDLADGRYEYKFVADGNWITDEAAVDFNDDGFGGKNSVVYVGIEPPAGAGGGQANAAAAAVTPGGTGTATIGGTAGGNSTAPRTGASGVLFQVAAPGAKDVFLAGSFNSWSADSQRMSDEDHDGVWTTSLPLSPGTYQYKFVIDGNWKEDAAAASFVDDGFGGKNSVLEISQDGAIVGGPSGAAVGGAGAANTAGTAGATGGATAGSAGGAPVDITFRYQPVISGDRDVFIAGDFNNWSADSDRMTDPDGDGVFEITLSLAPGKYAYKFVVQGNWMTDENAEDFVDDGFGGQNSLVYVGDAARPFEAEGIFNVTFRHKPAGKPGTIVLAGSFNDWSTAATPMTDADGDGTYEVTLILPGGEYPYKFVVDGNWTTDMNAESFVDDGFGGKNSVIRVDARLAAVDLKVGDGEIFTDGITHSGSLAERNILSDRLVAIRAKAYKDDVDGVTLVWRTNGGSWQAVPFSKFSDDVSMDHLEANVESAAPLGPVEYGIVYEDGGTILWLGAQGFEESAGSTGAVGTGGADGTTADALAQSAPAGFHYFAFDPATAPRFETPAWVRDGVFYQIFPDRFLNADKSNDPKFDQWYYEGKTRLPRVGKFNGEYYHFVKDWYDIDGLKTSPYRSDGRPDYFSFYGGDIEGVRQKLGYLKDLGISIIYFNPVFEAKSNHRYDAASYENIDPKLGTNEEFRKFVDEAHALGIRVIIDTVFNHTGNAHWAFKDCVDHGPKAEHWDWYEWKKWPLPESGDFKAEDYYECWWGFGDLPDVNFDLENKKTVENGITNIEDAEPNQAVVDYLLDSTRFWLTELDVDGLRLDVPNEVPLWFWKLFAEDVKKTKPDAYIIAELWGDASTTIGPGMFDATMNYRYFRDPVTKWIAQGNGSAAQFDRELAPGRFVYPPQAQQAMMNLLDSHDTVRFRTQAGGDARKLRLATLFQMTYVGAPHIYYGNEIAMEGGADPDCRRPLPWKKADEPERKQTLEWFQKLTAIRNGSEALRRGSFRTIVAEGPLYAYAREAADETVIVVINNSPSAVELPAERVLDGKSATVLFGDGGAAGATLASSGSLSLGAYSGGIYRVSK
ncbi:MAG: alpha-amylase family glycosyl hydrolase [Candidatus Eisenbacteria bacterium]